MPPGVTCVASTLIQHPPPTRQASYTHKHKQTACSVTFTLPVLSPSSSFFPMSYCLSSTIASLKRSRGRRDGTKCEMNTLAVMSSVTHRAALCPESLAHHRMNTQQQFGWQFLILDGHESSWFGTTTDRCTALIYTSTKGGAL